MTEPNDRTKSNDMNDQQGSIGIFIGALLAVAAVVFIATGGSLGGKKTVESDRDLPPVASETAPGQ